jgi:alkanesulfonate monooxygenase SsuD/methylene tetrahydromethanopterin reductase-like flavin-dependent oxidoreductase (luciferase family)
MGLELTPEHFTRRYDYASEYVQIMQDLWTKGVSDFKGDFFQMDDCKLSPRPSAHIPIVGAGQSAAGMDFVAKYGDYNFIGAGGDMNETNGAREQVAKVEAAAKVRGRDTGAFLLLMVKAQACTSFSRASMRDRDALSASTGSMLCAAMALASSVAERSLGAVTGPAPHRARCLHQKAARLHWGCRVPRRRPSRWRSSAGADPTFRLQQGPGLDRREAEISIGVLG